MILPIVFTVLLLSSGIGPTSEPADSSGAIRVGHVHFLGNHSFNDRALRRWMNLQPSGLFAHTTYDPERLEADLERLRTFYRGEGFLRARVQVATEFRNGKVDLSIRIDEGPRWSLTDCEVLVPDGSEGLRDSLLAILEIRPPGPYRLQKILADRNRLVAQLVSSGHLDARVVLEENRADSCRSARIRYLVFPGPRARLRDLSIEALRKTRPSVVAREMLIQPGDLLLPSKVAESKVDLLRTGLFSDVAITPSPADSGSEEKTLIVIATETQGGALGAGFGYGTSDRLRLLASVEQRNLGGDGVRVALSGRLGERRRGVECELALPWIGRSRVTTGLDFAVERLTPPAFVADQTRGSVSFSHPFGLLWKGELGYRAERVNFLELRGAGPWPTHSNIGALNAGVSRDSRIDLSWPQQGSYLDLAEEVSAPALGSSRLYSRSEIRRMTFTSNGSLILATRGDLGWILVGRHQDGIPPNERYFTGGGRTIRGFPEDALGPVDSSGRPQGGGFLLLACVEARHPLARRVGVSAFVDSGTLVNRPVELNFRSWSVGAGPGLVLDSPVGRLRLEAGFPVTRARRRGVQFYAGTGAAF